MALAQPTVPRERPLDPPLAEACRGRRWLVSFNTLLLGLTALPIGLAALVTPAGSVFTGYLVVARDAFVYQALWRAGWHGAWLFQPAYTTERSPAVLLYSWYLWTGHVVGGLPGPVVYQAARLLAGAALLAALYRLTAELFRSRLLRRWAYVLAALGGGVGILLPQHAQLGPVALRATEMASPGSSVADLVSMAPHLAAALALLCFVFTVAVQVRKGAPVRRLPGGLAALVGLELIYPQLALLGVLVVLGWAGARRSMAALRFGGLGAALIAPYLGYLAIAAHRAPSAFMVIRSSLDVGDPLGFLILSHLVATALIVIAAARRRLRGDLLLPALWIVVMTLFMFTPGLRGVLGRSFMASSIPFGLCAVPGLLALARGIRQATWRRRIVALALAASSLYGVFSLAQPFLIASGRLDPHAEYEPAGEALLLSRLDPRTSSRDVVLTTYLDGLFVPAQTSARVYVGHPDQTIDATAKARIALAYFTNWDAARRDRFLDEARITYVLAPDPGSALRLDQDSRLRLLDRAAGITLYAVVP